MGVKVIASHESKYPNPISFERGDALVVGRRDSEYSGWIWVTTSSGNQGWAPEQLVATTAPNQGFAKEAYCARELNTVEGEWLTLHRELNEWIWVENEQGARGWIPKKTTAPCSAPG